MKLRIGDTVQAIMPYRNARVGKIIKLNGDLARVKFDSAKEPETYSVNFLRKVIA